jgi:hypothetical protein
MRYFIFVINFIGPATESRSVSFPHARGYLFLGSSFLSSTQLSIDFIDIPFSILYLWPHPESIYPLRMVT